MANNCRSKCFDCAKAISGCQWIDWQEPINGWDAEPIIIKNCSSGYEHFTNSYIVKDCPLFKPDSVRITGEVLSKAFGVSVRSVWRNNTYYKRLFIEKYGDKAKQAGVRLVFGGVEC